MERKRQFEVIYASFHANKIQNGQLTEVLDRWRRVTQLEPLPQFLEDHSLKITFRGSERIKKPYEV